MSLAEMFLDLFASIELDRFGNVQAGELSAKTLFIEPLFHDRFVFDNFDAGFENIERHPTESFLVQLAKFVLVIVIIRRAKNGPADSALGDKCISAFRWLGRNFFGGI